MIEIGLLEAAVAPSAFHSSLERFDPPKYHPHTRETVRKKIFDWVTKKIDTNTFVLWLYGAASVRKLAIAQTIAEICHELKLLLASFFFSRSAPLQYTSKPFLQQSLTKWCKPTRSFRGSWRVHPSAIRDIPLVTQRPITDIGRRSSSLAGGRGQRATPTLIAYRHRRSQ